MLSNEQIEEFITQFPIYQYSFITPADVDHYDDVRSVCKSICKKYDTNWACPPAVAKVAKCVKRCAGYDNVLFFSSVGTVEKGDKKERKGSQNVHEELTRHIEDHLITNGYAVYTLTSDACSLCPKCAFPHEYCRHEELMHPCIESHGISVAELAQKCCMDYDMGRRLYIWFSLIYYREEDGESIHE